MEILLVAKSSWNPLDKYPASKQSCFWMQAKTFRKRWKNLTKETERNRDEVDTNTDRKFPLDLVQEL